MNDSATETNDHAEAIAAYLAHADAPCPTCGYDLKGCPTDRCPECGEVFVMRLGRRLAGGAWWWTAVAGVALAAGPVLLHALVRVYQIAQLTGSQALLMFGENTRPMVSLVVDLPRAFRFVALAMLLIAALIWLLCGRHAWRLMARRTQVILGLLGAAMPLIVLGVLALLIRG